MNVPRPDTDLPTTAAVDRDLDRELRQLAPQSDLTMAGRERIFRTATTRIGMNTCRGPAQRRRRLALGLGALVVVGSIAAMSPWWLDSTRGCLEDNGTPVARRVVSNGVIEVVALLSAPDASATGAMVRLTPREGPPGMIGSCTPADAPPSTGGSMVDPVADASLGGAFIDGDTGKAQTVDFGPVPDDVTQVELAWSDGHRETVEIDDGWWLATRELTDVTDDSWQPPTITRMVFTDDAGTSVAQSRE